jgi:hypothetical protein
VRSFEAALIIKFGERSRHGYCSIGSNPNAVSVDSKTEKCSASDHRVGEPLISYQNKWGEEWRENIPNIAKNL